MLKDVTRPRQCASRALSIYTVPPMRLYHMMFVIFGTPAACSIPYLAPPNFSCCPGFHVECVIQLTVRVFLGTTRRLQPSLPDFEKRAFELTSYVSVDSLVIRWFPLVCPSAWQLPQPTPG